MTSLEKLNEALGFIRLFFRFGKKKEVQEEGKERTQGRSKLLRPFSYCLKIALRKVSSSSQDFWSASAL
jgi:hypothetical protein